MSGFSIKADISGMLAGIDALADDIEAAARPAAQAGAQVLYEQTRSNVRSSPRDHYFYGTSFRKTGKRYLITAGTLRRSIYQVFSKDRSSAGDAVYHIGWNQKEAPYGHMVEFGTRKAPAHPFLRTAYASHSAIAQQAMETRFFVELKKSGATK